MGANAFYAPGAVKADTNFTVERGASLGTTAQRLEDQGLIPNSGVVPSGLIFRAGALGLKKQADLKAGVYLLKADYSMADILREITEGESARFLRAGHPRQHLVPGRRAAQRRQPEPDGRADQHPRRGLAAGHPLRFHPRRLAPVGARQDAGRDEGQGRRDLGRPRPVDRQRHQDARADGDPRLDRRKGNRARDRAPGSRRRVHQPAEVRHAAADRPDGALRRHRGQGGAQPRADRVRAARRQTAYNTYQIDGLPPGPIANPGEAALRAVARPAQTKALYFVAKSADPADGHLFADSYDAHSKNVSLYRKAAAEADAEAAREALEGRGSRRGCSALMATPLASMTGYARAAGALPGVAFTVELKSVNGRGLDMRMRLAPGFDMLEGEIRRAVGKSITRGSLTVSLSVDREGEGGRVVVNHQALEAILDGFKWLQKRVDARLPALDGILALRGVLEQHETAADRRGGGDADCGHPRDGRAGRGRAGRGTAARRARASPPSSTSASMRSPR